MILNDKRRARSFYKYFSKIYDYVNPIFYSKEMRRIVVEMANISKGDLVLEIGCGTGFTTEGISERVYKRDIVALDITPEQIYRAKRKLPRVNYFIGDAENLPFKDKTFDATISAGSIEYWPNPLKGIEEMVRVTKSDGKVVILAPRRPDNRLIRAVAGKIMLFPSTQQCVAWFIRAGLEKVRYVEVGPYSFWKKLAVIVSGEVP